MPASSPTPRALRWIPAIAALVTVAIGGCGARAPREDCTPVADLSPRSGLPTVWITVEGRPALMFLDTGWPGMMFHRGHLPDLPARGGPTYARKSWGKRNPMARLGQVAFTLAGREARFAKPERRLSPSILEEWGIDGIIGVQVFAAVASYLYFRAPDEVCFSGPPCISADKLWISTSVGDTALDTFVDTGATRTLIFDGSVRANALVLPGGRAVAAETPTAYVVNHHYGGAIVDGRAAGAVLGWQTLRTLDWDWDLCGGTVKFGRDDSEDSAED